MDEPLRTGLIGAGPWANMVHAPGLARHPRTQLVSVWARRPAAAAELAEKYGAQVAESPDELIEKVDAVAFAVPPDVQADVALRAAAAGRHLILEKPVAATVGRARELADAVGTAGVASLVMLTRRFAQETVEWLAAARRTDGWVNGDARLLNGALLGGPFAGSPWRQQRGGSLVDVGPHLLDLLDAALGRVVEVLAAHRTEADLWNLLLEHEGARTSTVTVSLRLPIEPAVSEISIYGEHGTLPLPKSTASALDSYVALLDDLVTMVDTGAREHSCDVRRGVHLQELIDRALAIAGV